MSPSAPITMARRTEAIEPPRRLASPSRRSRPFPHIRALNSARRSGLSGGRHEQVGLVPYKIALAVDRKLVVLAHENRADRTRFLAVTAENTPSLVNLIQGRVARTRLHRAVVLGRLQIDGIGGAGDGAQATGDALLEAVLVPHQHLFATVFREHRKF